MVRLALLILVLPGVAGAKESIDAWLWSHDASHYGQDVEGIRESARRLRELTDAIASASPEARQRSVIALVGIRASLSESLQSIVEKTNEGTLGDGPKASALFLMGELGLAECEETLRKEKDWEFSPNIEFLAIPGTPYGRRLEGMFPFPARGALNRAAFGDACEFSGYPYKTPLDQYPRLKKAVADLRSTDRIVRHRAEDIILLWNSELGFHLSEQLKSRREQRPEPVRAAAAYLLGEWRSFHSHMLLWFIDFEDSGGATATYRRSLSVPWDNRRQVCVEALLKVGRRARPYDAFGRIETHEEIPLAVRELTTRVFLESQAEDTIRVFRHELEWLSKPGSSLSDDKKAARLERLMSIESLITEAEDAGAR